MAIEGVAEEIATNLEEVAEVTRRIDTRSVGFLFGGLLIGASVGFYFGHRWNREKIKAEVLKEAQEEIAQIREYYRNKEIVREASKIVSEEKEPIEQIIEERGYSTREPEERPLKAPVPLSIAPVPPPIEENVRLPEWNYALEMARRTPDQPYVIHKDEFEGDENGYSQTSYTYYAVDDVLVDTDNRPLPHADVVVGQNNLRWGHGSEDPNLVFVRNDKLTLEMEITRVDLSFGEEVLGTDRDAQS